ncbi:MAG: tRNA guanosine(34) transglycosylase Tgt [Desulfuromonadales bacterium]|nr:tRNA guanosine(34) transglycosylase Tgt [Desulfuromonadales bacterium]
MKFKLIKKDPKSSARLGIITTPHGDIQTPIFMPVATHGAMKPLTPAQISETGAQIILSNTYHLHLQPGEGLVKKAGGLHKFMAWNKPILTDSGGFQVFSLPNKRITEDGVFFKHEITGDEIYLDPASAIRIQQDLGADIIMAFDECIPYPCDQTYAAQSTKKTIRWLKECQNAMTDNGQALFGIVQGSVYEELRVMCAKEMRALDLPGYAIGGVSVGEGLDLLKKVVSWTAPHLPEDKPRYLMGVGLPEDILESVERGIDMFDCVIPTRYGRSATLFTRRGKIRLTNKNYKRDFYPIDTTCDCYTCQNFTRAYLHHLFAANEVISAVLSAIHNVHFYLTMMEEIRSAITNNCFLEYKTRFLGEYLEGNRRKKQETF